MMIKKSKSHMISVINSFKGRTGDNACEITRPKKAQPTVWCKITQEVLVPLFLGWETTQVLRQ